MSERERMKEDAKSEEDSETQMLTIANVYACW